MKFFRLLAFALFFITSISGMRHSNRYFPFLRRPMVYHIKKTSDFSVDIFHTNASNAYDNSRNKISIPSLAGTYDIKDVINSLQEVTEKIDGKTFVNPFITAGGSEGEKFIDKSVRYEVSGRIKSLGIELGYYQDIYKGVSLGFTIPFMQVTSDQEFTKSFNDRTSSQNSYTGFEPLQDGEQALIDKARRQAHEDIGLVSDEFVSAGFGDLDFYIKYHASWEYKLYMRSIGFDVKGGVLFPTGEQRNLNRPASVPFTNNGHHGFYLETDSEFELKQDLTFGLMLGLLLQNSRSDRIRMSVGNEPYFYSALAGNARVQPGYTLKLSPYLEFAGLADGLSGQMRLTHIRHGQDNFKDKRSASDQAALASTFDNRENSSKWIGNFLTFQATYDSKEAMKDWSLEPKIFASYDFPFDWLGGRRAVRTHKLTLGVELSF